MKTHFLIYQSEECNPVFACGLKYKDLDNITFTSDINEVTCEKCLKNIQKPKSKLKELEKKVKRILRYWKENDLGGFEEETGFDWFDGDVTEKTLNLVLSKIKEIKE